MLLHVRRQARPPPAGGEPQAGPAEPERESGDGEAGRGTRPAGQPERQEKAGESRIGKK